MNILSVFANEPIILKADFPWYVFIPVFFLLLRAARRREDSVLEEDSQPMTPTEKKVLWWVGGVTVVVGVGLILYFSLSSRITTTNQEKFDTQKSNFETAFQSFKNLQQQVHQENFAYHLSTFRKEEGKPVLPFDYPCFYTPYYAPVKEKHDRAFKARWLKLKFEFEQWNEFVVSADASVLFPSSFTTDYFFEHRKREMESIEKKLSECE